MSYNPNANISYSSRLEGMLSSYTAQPTYAAASSGLDYMLAAEPSSFNPQIHMYDFADVRNEVYADSYRPAKRVSETYSHSVDHFLNPQRTRTAFIGKASEVKEFVEEAFEKLTGREFPDDIQVNIVSASEISKMHPSNVLGFALNRKHLGLISEIFIKEDMMDRLMLTIGHELGHVLTRRLPENKDEEAKAFSFSLAWMKTIKEHDIANLAGSIQLDAPAKNGLHDVALDFVLNLMKKGKAAMDIYADLIRGFTRVGDENSISD